MISKLFDDLHEISNVCVYSYYPKVVLEKMGLADKFSKNGCKRTNIDICNT